MWKQKALEVSAYCRFCAANWLNIGVRILLTEVSAKCRKEISGTQVGVHLIEGVFLKWGVLTAGFTVLLLAKSK